MPKCKVMHRLAGGALALALLSCVSSTSLAADIWYEDNNLGRAGGTPPDFVEKFRRPDTFRQASGYIDVYLMRANTLHRMDDGFFTELLFPYLKKNNIKLALNAGGATWLQAKPRRERVFDNNIDLLRRLKDLGGRVDYISLQSVLSKPLRINGKRAQTDYPMDKRIEDVVTFAKAAREVYPDVKIGIIDALLSHGKDYRKPYRALKKALDAEGFDLSYVHLDISFDAPRRGRRGVTWKTIRQLEDYVERDLGAQFGLYAKSRRAGYRSSRDFRDAVLSSVECYAGSGGTPRDYVISSWFPYPEKTIPETATGDDYPAMRIVLEAGRRVEEIKKGPAAWASAHSGDRQWQRQCGVGAAR